MCLQVIRLHTHTHQVGIISILLLLQSRAFDFLSFYSFFLSLTQVGLLFLILIAFLLKTTFYSFAMFILLFFFFYFLSHFLSLYLLFSSFLFVNKRYVAIVRPLHRRNSRKKARMFVIIIWILSSMLSLPCLFYSTTEAKV